MRLWGGGQLLAVLIMLIIMLIIVFIILLLIPSANGIMGYDISVRVNDSSLEIHRSIQEMRFNSAGLVDGFGNFSRFSSIEGFAGIRAHEVSSSPWSGRIGYADQLALRLGEGPVQIAARLQSNVLYSGSDPNFNESQKVAISEYGAIEVDEKWKAFFGNRKRILYSGPGMSVRESYENNGDYVKNCMESWELYRESLYQTALNRTLISANLTAHGVDIDQKGNRSTLFMLKHGSVGRNTHFDIGRADRSNEGESRIIEDYSGQQNITMRLNMGDWIMRPDDDRGWLDCCRPDP